LVCAKMTHWSLDGNNLPYQYTVNAGVLTKENSDAATLDNTYCMGFEIDVRGTGGTDEIECKYYYDAISTGNTDRASDSTDFECFNRNLSTLAQTYSDNEVKTTTDSGNWDAFDTAMTNWSNAYQILIDKRLDLEIATNYLTTLGTTTGVDASGADAGAVNVNAADYYNDGYKQRWSDSVNATGLVQLYNAKDGTHASASSDYTASSDAYSARAVLIASANSDYLLAQAQWEENNALISKLTILTEIAEAASDAAFTAEEDAEEASEDAYDDWEDAVDAYAGIEAVGETAAV